MGILLVFSMTDKSSFNSIELWMRQIRLYAGESIPVIILCNKVDVNSKEVSEVQSRGLGQRHGLNTIYTSALDNKNITECVLELYNRISDGRRGKSGEGGLLQLRGSAQTTYCGC